MHKTHTLQLLRLQDASLGPLAAIRPRHQDLVPPGALYCNPESAVILCCVSSSTFKLHLMDHLVPARCLNLAAAGLRADRPSGKAPTRQLRLPRANTRLQELGLEPWCYCSVVTAPYFVSRRSSSRMSPISGA